MTLKVVGNVHFVSYCGTHTSHELEIKHLRISSSVKQQVASKLRMGVRIKSILKDIRENNDPAYAQIKFITHKAIRNIIAKECIEQDYKLDDVDAHSVAKFVQKDNGQTVLL